MTSIRYKDGGFSIVLACSSISSKFYIHFRVWIETAKKHDENYVNFDQMGQLPKRVHQLDGFVANTVRMITNVAGPLTLECLTVRPVDSNVVCGLELIQTVVRHSKGKRRQFGSIRIQQLLGLIRPSLQLDQQGKQSSTWPLAHVPATTCRSSMLRCAKLAMGPGMDGIPTGFPWVPTGFPWVPTGFPWVPTCCRFYGG